ncbi:CoA transferase [Aeromicrobium sp. UC242_57]|uniref:CoA transferase n=1 Tax=Aeromicrobium sp. UC242_57 TaxID=3374624 RepID=UPI0037B679BF
MVVRFRRGADPTIDLPRWFFTDYAAGVLAAFGTVAGLYARARSVGSINVETSLVRATMLEQICWVIELDSETGAPAAETRRDARGWSPLQRLYRTADGWVFLGASREQFIAICSAMGLDVDADPAIDRLMVDLEMELQQADTERWTTAFSQAGAGFHRVATLAEAMVAGGPADELGLRLEDETAMFGAVVMPGPVVSLSRTPMIPGALPQPFGSDLGAFLHDLADGSSVAW